VPSCLSREATQGIALAELRLLEDSGSIKELTLTVMRFFKVQLRVVASLVIYGNIYLSSKENLAIKQGAQKFVGSLDLNLDLAVGINIEFVLELIERGRWGTEHLGRGKHQALSFEGPPWHDPFHRPLWLQTPSYESHRLGLMGCLQLGVIICVGPIYELSAIKFYSYDKCR